jgi:zinc transport system substrate-binding protein
MIGGFVMATYRARQFFLVCLLGFATIAGCSGLKEPDNDEGAAKLTVYTVNYPLRYFAERIGVEHVEAFLPAPVEGDPAHWRPDKATIEKYREADLVLLNGKGYAAWVANANLPAAQCVETTASFSQNLIKRTHSHSHGDHTHEHQTTDYHTWLDPNLAIKQAESIEKAFAQKRADRANDFAANLATLKAELTDLDATLRTLADSYDGRPLLASHPVYDYLIRAYDLPVTSLHWEPNLAPSGDEWVDLQNYLDEHPVEWMIWEAEPDKDIADKLRRRGVSVAVFEPCMNVPADEDYMKVMLRNIENLRPVFASD